MRGRASLAVLLLLAAVPPSGAQIVAPEVPEVARVWFDVPHLVRGEPGGTVRFSITVNGELDCVGDPPRPLRVYMNTGNQFVQMVEDQPPVKVWTVEPHEFTVSWEKTSDGYRIDERIHVTVVSEGAPTTERDHALGWAVTSTGTQEGTCPAGHDVWAAPAQSAILMPALPQEQTAPAVGADEGKDASGVGLALVLPALAAWAARRRSKA